jgi:glucoamylase
VKPFIRAIEGFASTTGLLPEQVWDEPDRPAAYMFLGRATGSAMPLMWAHAEYIKLFRSVSDNRVFEVIREAAKRYLGERKTRQLFEVWKPNRQARTVKRGYTLRIQVPVPFRFHWSANEWQPAEDSPSSAPVLGFHFVDIPVPAARQAPIRFTFYWAVENRWEGRDYLVAVE